MWEHLMRLSQQVGLKSCRGKIKLLRISTDNDYQITVDVITLQDVEACHGSNRKIHELKNEYSRQEELS